MCLDKRGLMTFPWIIDEPKLRLISLQHNLISRMEKSHLSRLSKLVFLDLYDNQIENFCNLDPLENLRVLLMGKNRIKKIEGLKNLTKLEVLDLHGNEITQVSGLEGSRLLKVLNLAGNNVKGISNADFQGLVSLVELNLKRNKIKQLRGFDNTPQLRKLYLSNNDIQRIEDLSSVTKAVQLKEISLDGNPVTALTSDCTSFLVSFLPNLQLLSATRVNDQLRKSAMAWRTSKERCNTAFLDLSAQVCVQATRRQDDRVVPSAKFDWGSAKSKSKTKSKSKSKSKSDGSEASGNRDDDDDDDDDSDDDFTRYNNSLPMPMPMPMPNDDDDYSDVNCVDGNEDLGDDRDDGDDPVIATYAKSTKHRDRLKSNDFDDSTQNVSDRRSGRAKRCCSGKQRRSLRAKNRTSILQLDGLDFKLPPILVPIIDNLTNDCCCFRHHYHRQRRQRQRQHRSKSHRAERLDEQINRRKNFSSDSSDSSDLDSSSESHRSLKSGLRNYLVFRSLRRSASMTMVDRRESNGKSIEQNLNNDDDDDDDNDENDDNIDKNNKSNSSKKNHKKARAIWSCDKEYRWRWDSMSKSSSLDSSGKSFIDDSSSSTSKSSNNDNNNNNNNNNNKTGRVTSAPSKKVTLVGYKNNRASAVQTRRKMIAPVVSNVPSLDPLPFQDKEQGGDYLLEITGRCLNIYGQGALRLIHNKQWDLSKANEIKIVKFNYVHFNGIATILNKLKHSFPNAEQFHFKETNICHIGQLNALAEAQGLGSLNIEVEGNPIMAKDWIAYAIFRLAHWGLQNVNGTQITDESIIMANQQYSGLVDIVMWSLPETLLQPLLHRLHLERVRNLNGELMTAKQFLFSCDSSLRDVVSKEALQWHRSHITQDDLIWRHKGKVFLSNSIELTAQSVQKLKVLNEEWPRILCQIIFETLGTYSNMINYMKNCLEALEDFS